MKKYPFKFLDSYTPNDKDIFFGRDDEVNELYEIINQSPIIWVYGTSGTGKTSLIQCGLALKFQPHERMVIMLRRGSEINASLEKALREAGGDRAIEYWDASFLYEESTPVETGIKELTGPAKSLQTIYHYSFKPVHLVFDQLEELYILGSEDEQKKFIQTIQEILQADLPVKLIFSIREEYLGHLYEFERVIPQLLQSKLRIEPMNFEKLTDVLEGINEHKNSNVKIKNDQVGLIAKTIFEKLRGDKKSLTIQLPFLQVLLDKVYFNKTKDESRQAETIITNEDLEAVKSIGDVLRDFLEEQVGIITLELGKKYPGLTTVEIWKILAQLTTLEGTKVPVSKEQLVSMLPGMDRGLISEAVEAFVNRRILNYSENDNLYEIAHDSLALRVATKRSEEDTTLLQVRLMIKNQVLLNERIWEPLSEKQLNFIEPSLSKLELDNKEVELVAASQLIAKRMQGARRRVATRIFAGLIAVVAIMIVLTVLAFRNSKAARRQEKLAIAAKDTAELSNQRKQLALVALEKEKQYSDSLTFTIVENNTERVINGRICPPPEYFQVLDKISFSHPDSTRLKNRVRRLRNTIPNCPSR